VEMLRSLLILLLEAFAPIIKEVIYENTYFPKAKTALKDLTDQVGFKPRFVAYQQDASETYFFFSSDHKVEFCNTPDEFETLALSKSPVIFYITKENFSKLDKKLHGKLKIVYAFGKQLFVTNQLELVPPFSKSVRR